MRDFPLHHGFPLKKGLREGERRLGRPCGARRPGAGAPAADPAAAGAADRRGSGSKNKPNTYTWTISHLNTNKLINKQTQIHKPNTRHKYRRGSGGGLRRLRAWWSRRAWWSNNYYDNTIVVLCNVVLYNISLLWVYTISIIILIYIYTLYR